MVVDTQTLPVLFMTRTPYPLPSHKFMIPASWRRYQLSQLVNKALSLLQPVPFDFLVRGDVLRSSLADWCNERGVGMEETLEIEYIESLMPPQRVSSIPHNDWVSSVSCQLPGRFITASYDGLIRVFDSSQELTHTIAGHTAAVTSVCPIPQGPLDADSDTRVLASASHDMTARLTSFSPESQTSRALATLHLHTSPLSSISASPFGSHLLTAGWDALVGVWDTAIPAVDEVADAERAGPVKKRRRGIEKEVSGEDTLKRKAPLAVLKSHTGRVTGAVFAEEEGAKKAVSCGLDSTVRSWDVEIGICVNTLTAPEKPFLALTLLAFPHLLAAASSDRTVSIYDMRAFFSKSTPLVASLPHAATPACLARSPANAQHVASGAYDGVVRVWDVRSAKGAMASFRAGEGADAKKRGDGKILGLDWARDVMGVGGEAGLDVWRVPEGGSKAE